MKIVIMAALALALSACATKPIAMADAVPVPNDRLLAYQGQVAGEQGTVITIRDAGFTGGGCNMAVYIDGTLAARIGAGEVASFNVTAGDHIIGTGPTGRGTCAWASDRLRKETPVNLRNGEKKRFRISINPNSGPAIEPTAF